MCLAATCWPAELDHELAGQHRVGLDPNSSKPSVYTVYLIEICEFALTHRVKLNVCSCGKRNIWRRSEEVLPSALNSIIFHLTLVSVSQFVLGVIIEADIFVRLYTSAEGGEVGSVAPCPFVTPCFKFQTCLDLTSWDFSLLVCSLSHKAVFIKITSEVILLTARNLENVVFVLLQLWSQRTKQVKPFVLCLQETHSLICRA